MQNPEQPKNQENADANKLAPKESNAQDIVEDLQNALKEIDSISKELQK